MSTTTPSPTTTRPRRRWPWVVATLGALGVAGYGALALSAGSKTPGDTVIGGVQVGGMTHDEATVALQKGLQDKASAKIPVRFGEESIQLDPSTSGLGVDYAKSLDGLTGVTVNPATLYDRLTGSIDRPPALLLDQEKLTAAITTGAAAIADKPVNAQLTYADGAATVTPGVDGQGADAAATAEAVAKGWLVVEPINGVLATTEPNITTGEAESAKTEIADKIVSGPLVVKVGEESFKVSPAALAKGVTFAAKDGALAPVYDAKTLIAAVRRAGEKAEVLRAGKDAVVTSADGSFKVAPSVDGLDIDAEAAPAAIEAALVSAERIAQIPGKAAPAKFTTAEAKASLPTGVISTFTTQFPYSPDRTHNITLAARALNGVYVAPGETFSLNEHLGQRTPEKGYRGAPVIYNGRLAKDYGGGISQVSTTLFNAIFFSGARIDEYHPHSFYISRYPEGREATISWPDVDNRFTNTTKGGILITTKVTSNAITVTFQGKKTWDIEATKGPRTAITSPKEITDDSAGCVPQSKQDGFTVTVGRIFKKSGKVVDTQYLTTHYIPEDQVICTNPNAG